MDCCCWKDGAAGAAAAGVADVESANKAVKLMWSWIAFITGMAAVVFDCDQ